MNRMQLFLILVFFIPLSAFSSDFADNVSFGFSSAPQPEGDMIRGHIGYQYSDALSGRVSIRNERSTSTGTVSDIENSLKVTEESTLIANVFPVQYQLDISSLKLTAGLGINTQMLNSKETGHFVLNSENQIFDNTYRALFYAPMMRAGLRYRMPGIVFSYAGNGAPVYWYTFDQTISIDPLISEKGTNWYRSDGGPYLENEVKLTLFNYLRLNVEHTYQIINFTLQNMDVANDGWTSSESKYQINGLALIGSIVLDLKEMGMGTGSVEIGGGIDYSFTKDLKNSDAEITKDSSPVFNIGFEF